MRITDKIIQERMLRGLQMASARLSETHRRIATNKSINHPSDDPVGNAKAMNYHRDLYKVRQTIKNGDSATALFNFTDSALEKAGEILTDVRNKVSAMATDTVDGDARRAIASEVDIMTDEMLQLANTKFAGRYIFSGHKILQTPYQINGDDIEYVGDQGEIKQRVELGEAITVNVPGSRVFGLGSASGGIFKVLKDVKEALESNNANRIRDSLTYIDIEIERIAIVRGELGVKMKRTQSSIDQLHMLELSLTESISQIEEVDLAMEAGKYMANQEAYQAALQATSSILKLPSLTDFLS